jgi:hypothetical protein
MAGAQDSSTTAPAPDNAKVNQRDANKSAPTADQQKANKANQETTRQIRQAVMQDKSLSTYALPARKLNCTRLAFAVASSEGCLARRRQKLDQLEAVSSAYCLQCSR